MGSGVKVDVAVCILGIEAAIVNVRVEVGKVSGPTRIELQAINARTNKAMAVVLRMIT